MLTRLALLALLTPSLATAHAILVSSDPPPGATLPPGPRTLTLRYNSRIDQSRSKLTLDHSGYAVAARLDRPAPPNELRTTATLSSGAYTLRWFVLATDGHITRGEVPFTVQR